MGFFLMCYVTYQPPPSQKIPGHVTGNTAVIPQVWVKINK